MKASNEDMEKLLKEFGNKVREVRENAGLSREELAERMNKVDSGKIKRCLTRFGQNVREAREGAGLSVEELALRTGIKPNRIRRIEAGTYNCELSTSDKIASALEVHIVSLYRDI